MAAKQTGLQGAVFVEDAHDFDPQFGDTYSVTWRGPKAAILAKTALYRAAGWRCARRKAGGAVYELIASIVSVLGTTSGGIKMARALCEGAKDVFGAKAI